MRSSTAAGSRPNWQCSSPPFEGKKIGRMGKQTSRQPPTLQLTGKQTQMGIHPRKQTQIGIHPRNTQ
jgi:hypothetical protein